MSTTLEAETDTAATEAAAALEAENDAAIRQHEDAELSRRAEELEAAAAAGKFEESAGITDEQEAGAASGDEPKPKRQRKRSQKTDEQGTLEGKWEQLIGGAPDTELKLSLQKPAAIQFENQPESLRKQTVHRILITVKVTGFASDDTLDPETHDVASSAGKRKLRVLSGQFLDPEDYIASAEDDTDVAAEAAADAADQATS